MRECPYLDCFADIATRHNLPLAFWICDENGKFIFAKGAIINNVVGNTCWRLFDGDSRMWTIYTQVLHDRKTVRYNLEFQGRHWDCIMEPLQRGCQGIAIETTYTRNLEDKWDTLVETIPFAIGLVEPDGTMIQCSSALPEMLGYTKGEFVGQKYQDYTHPDDLEPDVGKHQELVEGKIKSYSMEKRYIHKDGHIVYVFLEVGLVQSTNLAIAYIKDISETVEKDRNLVLDKKALEGIFNNEFYLQYQPVIRLSDREIVGYEGLVRWDSANEIIYPDEFISKLSPPTQLLLTLEILKLACVQLKALKLRGLENKWVAINLSPYDIKNKSFLSRFNAVVEAHGSDRSKIRLEITEQDILSEPWMLQVLSALRGQGHVIEIDDFGSGYSSLGALTSYPVSVIKVDKTLIDHIPGNHEKEKVFRLILTMGETLGYEVIAEGVETEEQAKWLEYNGCGFAQGYLFGRPGDI